MKQKTEFSILMAVYKKDDPILFLRALSSILSNTLQPLETVLVADGELTEDLNIIIKNFSNKMPINFIQLPKNVGLAKALNAGLSVVSTKYTIRADSDDYNYPNRFSCLINKLEEGFDLVGSSIREVDKSGTEIAYRKCPTSGNEIRKFARKRNPFNHMTVGFLTSAVVDVGGYPPIYLKEDYALWATLLAKEARVCNLETVLVDASAGVEMFQRRGGLRYAMAEIDLQHHLAKCGLKSVFVGIIGGGFRSLIFLAPNIARQFFYLYFLRKKL